MGGDDAAGGDESAPLRTASKERCPLCGRAGERLYDELQDGVFGVPGKWGMRRCPRTGLRSAVARPAADRGGPASSLRALLHARLTRHGRRGHEPPGGGARGGCARVPARSLAGSRSVAGSGHGGAAAAASRLACADRHALRMSPVCGRRPTSRSRLRWRAHAGGAGRPRLGGERCRDGPDRGARCTTARPRGARGRSAERGIPRRVLRTRAADARHRARARPPRSGA